MPSPARRLWLALALVASCAAFSVQAEVRVPAVLESPASGDVLRGGTRATVSWSAPALPAFVEEWEAFLSVDGGEYYGYRITPHLDAQRREFTFDVPNVDAPSARILIRAGDEHREIELETSGTFVIERDPARALAAPPGEIIEEKRGESAREGDRGVIEWIDGDRDGHHLVERTAFGHETLLAATVLHEPKSLCGEEEAGASIGAPRTASARLARTDTQSPRRDAPRHRSGRDVLLAYRRLNI